LKSRSNPERDFSFVRLYGRGYDHGIMILPFPTASRKPVMSEYFQCTTEADEFTVEWNGLNAANESVSSGVFFVRMTSDKFSAVRKVMLLK